MQFQLISNENAVLFKENGNISILHFPYKPAAISTLTADYPQLEELTEIKVSFSFTEMVSQWRSFIFAGNQPQMPLGTAKIEFIDFIYIFAYRADSRLIALEPTERRIVMDMDISNSKNFRNEIENLADCLPCFMKQIDTDGYCDFRGLALLVHLEGPSNGSFCSGLKSRKINENILNQSTKLSTLNVSLSMSPISSFLALRIILLSQKDGSVFNQFDVVLPSFFKLCQIADFSVFLDKNNTCKIIIHQSDSKDSTFFCKFSLTNSNSLLLPKFIPVVTDDTLSSCYQRLLHQLSLLDADGPILPDEESKSHLYLLACQIVSFIFHPNRFDFYLVEKAFYCYLLSAEDSQSLRLCRSFFAAAGAERLAEIVASNMDKVPQLLGYLVESYQIASKVSSSFYSPNAFILVKKGIYSTIKDHSADEKISSASSQSTLNCNFLYALISLIEESCINFEDALISISTCKLESLSKWLHSLEIPVEIREHVISVLDSIEDVSAASDQNKLAYITRFASYCQSILLEFETSLPLFVTEPSFIQNMTLAEIERSAYFVKKQLTSLLIISCLANSCHEAYPQILESIKLCSIISLLNGHMPFDQSGKCSFSDSTTAATSIASSFSATDGILANFKEFTMNDCLSQNSLINAASNTKLKEWLFKLKITSLLDPLEMVSWILESVSGVHFGAENYSMEISGKSTVLSRLFFDLLDIYESRPLISEDDLALMKYCRSKLCLIFGYETSFLVEFLIFAGSRLQCHGQSNAAKESSLSTNSSNLIKFFMLNSAKFNFFSFADILSNYYFHCMNILSLANYFEESILFGKLAIQSLIGKLAMEWESEIGGSSLIELDYQSMFHKMVQRDYSSYQARIEFFDACWLGIFQNYLELKQFSEAYSCLSSLSTSNQPLSSLSTSNQILSSLSTSNQILSRLSTSENQPLNSSNFMLNYNLQEKCLKKLVSSICSNGCKELLKFPFKENILLVLQIIEDSAEMDIKYYDILYAFYMNTADYRGASAAMFKKAVKLALIIHDRSSRVSDNWVELQKMHVKALLASLNILELDDEKHILVPTHPLAILLQGNEPDSSTSKVLLSNSAADSKCIYKLDEIRRIYLFSLSSLILYEYYPELPNASNETFHLQYCLSLLSKKGYFDLAFELSGLCNAYSCILVQELVGAYRDRNDMGESCDCAGDSHVDISGVDGLHSRYFVNGRVTMKVDDFMRFYKRYLVKDYEYIKLLINSFLEIKGNIPSFILDDMKSNKLSSVLINDLISAINRLFLNKSDNLYKGILRNSSSAISRSVIGDRLVQEANEMDINLLEFAHTICMRKITQDIKTLHPGMSKPSNLAYSKFTGYKAFNDLMCLLNAFLPAKHTELLELLEKYQLKTNQCEESLKQVQ